MNEIAVPEVPPAEADASVQNGALLLDVREPDEWGAGHAPGALHMPMAEVVQRRHELPADRAIVVMCRSGARSARVTAALLSWGHDATNVAGGLQEWAAAGLPVVTDDGQPGRVA